MKNSRKRNDYSISIVILLEKYLKLRHLYFFYYMADTKVPKFKFKFKFYSRPSYQGYENVTYIEYENAWKQVTNNRIYNTYTRTLCKSKAIGYDKTYF